MTKNKLLTLKKLQKTWWWKREENRSEMERLKIHGYELAARNYELMRRSPNAGEYQQNYLRLDRENKTVASIAWVNPYEMPNRNVFDLQKQEEIGWTSARPHYQWNLRLSDRALTKAFLFYINQHRTVQKIASSNSPKGKKNRPPSWLYIEYLDMRQNGIGGMDDSQRGMASRAEEMAAQFLSEFKRAEIKKDEIAQKWFVYDESDDSSQVPYF